MPRHALSFLILALVIAMPARASHRHTSQIKTPAKTVAATPVTPSAPISSTKGTRLVANSFLPGERTMPKKSPQAVLKAAARTAAKSKPAAAVASAVHAAVEPLVRLARLTAYWTQEDPWTAKHESSTGVRLHEGHCAVDPKLIPYGSTVQIPGMGNYVAVDTGSAVISRQAAIGSGQTEAQRNALVVDLFFETRKDAEAFAAHGPSYVAITLTKPSASADSPLNPRALPAIPKLPAGTVYFLAQAPTLADASTPLAFRKPQL